MTVEGGWYNFTADSWQPCRLTCCGKENCVCVCVYPPCFPPLSSNSIVSDNFCNSVADWYSHLMLCCGHLRVDSRSSKCPNLHMVLYIFNEGVIILQYTTAWIWVKMKSGCVNTEEPHTRNSVCVWVKPCTHFLDVFSHVIRYCVIHYLII